jgi:hypothetical protein
VDSAGSHWLNRANLRSMYWPPPPSDEFPFDDAMRYRQPIDERLRHLVFLDGRLIDTWTEPVEGTVYREQARELDRVQPPGTLPILERPPAPHEAVLEWLDSTVGGRAALAALDEQPLAAVAAPEDADEAYEAVAMRLERLCAGFFDDEFLAATTTALTALHAADPNLLLESSPAEVAAGLCWMVGRANGCVGAGTKVTQQVLKRELWISTSPSRRVTKYKTVLRGLLPIPPHRPSACPDLVELGSPAYLTSATRHTLISLRERGLAAAEVAAADEEARRAPHR